MSRLAGAVIGALASTRTAVVLLALVAAAAVVGTVLPDPVAHKYVYGRLWFHVLLGLLGLSLVACMVRRGKTVSGTVCRDGPKGASHKRFLTPFSPRAWSLLTHSGILLVLVGAMVTLILAERGAIIIREGQELSAFVPEGQVPQAHHRNSEPLGFAVRLLDFRITRYPPLDHLSLKRTDGRVERLRLGSGGPVDIPGSGWSASVKLVPDGNKPFVDVRMSGGHECQVSHEGSYRTWVAQDVPAERGSYLLQGAPPLANMVMKVLRYEPSFKIDLKTKKVTSDTEEPRNPAVLVQIIRDGKKGRLRWLFAKMPRFGLGGRGHHKSTRARDVRLLYFHPAAPISVAEVKGPAGTHPLRMLTGDVSAAPWEPGLVLAYVREARIKEYESEVEVIEGGKVVRRHVIRVNSPLVHKGTKLSQVGYDQKGLRWTRLGVSRDKGVWFVYAGFLATTLGLIGNVYLRPALRSMRAGSTQEGGGDGSSC